MKYIQTEWALLMASIAAFLGVGISISLMFLEGYVIGAAFWVCLLAGITLQIIVSLRCRKLRQKFASTAKQRIGLLSFCQNTYGIAADLTTAIALVAFVLTILFHATLVLQLSMFGLLVFGFSMHCVCNGKNIDLLMRLAQRGRRHQSANGEQTQGGTQE